MLQRPDQIAQDTLERYTNSRVEEFGKYVLLTNFPNYVDLFSQILGVEIREFTWNVSHAPQEDLSIINFSIGSPMAGMVMDVLTYTDPTAVLMLGLCGGIDDDLELGDYIVPTASIRDEGTSGHYLHPSVPALPSLTINNWVCRYLAEQNVPFHTGIMKTTDYRMWEFDEAFREELETQRVMAIDMEIATLFGVAYARAVPIGALMLVSDLPLRKGGIKTKESAKAVLAQYTEQHLRLGIGIMQGLRGKMGPGLRTTW